MKRIIKLFRGGKNPPATRPPIPVPPPTPAVEPRAASTAAGQDDDEGPAPTPAVGGDDFRVLR